MNQTIKLLDVVAATQHLPSLGVRRGQVGTVVEILGDNVFEIEFSDNEGRTFAQGALHSDQLLVLYYDPEAA